MSSQVSAATPPPVPGKAVQGMSSQVSAATTPPVLGKAVQSMSSQMSAATPPLMPCNQLTPKQLQPEY